MLPTYLAMLRAGQLDWGADGPPPLPPGTVPVHITLLTPSLSTADGPAMSAALAALAEAGGPSGFGDPAEWQRETRAERPLPGREG
jgi:hypothetical protein